MRAAFRDVRGPADPTAAIRAIGSGDTSGAWTPLDKDPRRSLLKPPRVAGRKLESTVIELGSPVPVVKVDSQRIERTIRLDAAAGP